MLRDAPYAVAKTISARRRMDQAAIEPATLPDLIRWFRREWAAEMPGRIHERGIEPDSGLGSPRLAGAFRAYLAGSPMATDHDDRLDMTTAGDARRLPIHAALNVMSRKWPLSSRFLFALAWAGADWVDVAALWTMPPEIGHRFTHDALHHLWEIWARSEAVQAE